MPGARAVIDRASQDARAKGFSRIEFIAPELGDLHSSAVSNILTYEYGAIPGSDKGLYVPGGLTYHFPEELTFTASDELFWKMKWPDDSDAKRLDNVVTMMLSESPDYLLLPDEKTLEWLEHDRTFNFINQKTRILMTRLLATNRFASLGDAVAVDTNEKIEVFAPRAAQ
jgi:hypothetical protein